MDNLTLDRSYSKGSNGQKVRLIQEWLCLHGFNVVIDGDFGPATDYAVRAFQKMTGLRDDGVVNDVVFGRLVLPMTNALKPLNEAGGRLGDLVVKYAEKHAQQHPREIGGQNKGPWVRLYMQGNEGASWPWCAGFAGFVLRQACETLDVPLPIPLSFSCDALAANARVKGRFLTEADAAERRRITPGSLFLARKTPADWEHTGIVMRSEAEIFHTIEGNTNDEGSREGYEVCGRIRSYSGKDFIIV